MYCVKKAAGCLKNEKNSVRATCKYNNGTLRMAAIQQTTKGPIHKRSLKKTVNGLNAVFFK